MLPVFPARLGYDESKCLTSYTGLFASVGNGETDNYIVCWQEIIVTKSVPEMKAAAARLRKFLKTTLNIEISHSHSLEAAATY